jgi:group I intron endonuclease
MVVYKVTNMINGKVYIGKTESGLKVRKVGHYQSVKKGSETNFHRALRKGNRNDFKWEILNEYSTKKDMDTAEINYITEYDAYENGYNMTEGGDGGITYQKGDELYERIKHKLGKWKCGNPGATDEAIAKRIETFKSVKWVTGELHGNFGHSRNKGKYIGKDNPNAKSITIDGITYSTITEASKTLNTSTSAIAYRCKSKNYKSYKYN